MKRLPLSAAALSWAFITSSFALAAPVPVTSQLTAVSVYLDRAVLTRTAKVELPAGNTELILDHLPAGLLDESLQVSGRGTAGATILDVNARLTYLEASPDPRIRTLEDELASLRRDDAVIAARLAQLDQQRALLQKIETAMTAPPPRDATTTGPRPSFDEWQKLLTFQTENLSRLATDQQSFQRQRTELAAKIAAVEAQLNDLRGRTPARRSQKTVTIRLAATRPGSLDLTVSYAAPGASWTPAYDARLRTDTRTVELTYYGVIRNGTGEDWRNLALTLSTARPSLGGGAPELAPWIVDVSRPVPRPTYGSLDTVKLSTFEVRAKSRAAPAAAGAVLEAEAAPMVADAEIAQASVETGTTSATFRVEAPVSLPSDRSTQKVAITTINCPATLRYETTPKLVEAAFLGASVANASEFPLLAGVVNTFLGDTFVASSRMKTVMPSERFDLALGADDAIAVKRRVVNRFTEDTGLTNRGRRVTYEFLITLTNNKKTSERIVLRESIPVSRDEKIVVKLLSPSERDIGATEGQKEITREPEGRLAWRLDLKPGEKREIPLKVSVEHPADLAVTGLD